MSTAKFSCSRFAVVASTGGSVFRKALSVKSFRDSIELVVVDRKCGAEEVAAEFEIPLERIYEKDSEAFSDALSTLLRERKIDAAFSFYLRLFRGKILKEFENRLINFHPSLLPSYKGFQAIERAREEGIPYLGTTAHVIDESIDGGAIILQGVFLASLFEDETSLRHKIFTQQVQELLQVASWLRAGRVTLDGGKVRILDCQFEATEFSPSLDDADALALASE